MRKVIIISILGLFMTTVGVIPAMGFPSELYVDSEVKPYIEEIFETYNETYGDYFVLTYGPVSKTYADIELTEGSQTQINLINKYLDRKLLRPFLLFRTVVIFVNNLSYTVEYKKDLDNSSKYSYFTVNATVKYNESGDVENVTNVSGIMNKKHAIYTQDMIGFFIFWKFKLYDFKAPRFNRLFCPARFSLLGFSNKIIISETSSPSLAWTVDMLNNNITISAGSATHTYAMPNTVANLVFRNGSTEYYVKENLSIGSDPTGFSTKTISAGDVISGFPAGTYDVIWKPTDEVIGNVAFT